MDDLRKLAEEVMGLAATADSIRSTGTLPAGYDPLSDAYRMAELAPVLARAVLASPSPPAAEPAILALLACEHTNRRRLKSAAIDLGIDVCEDCGAWSSWWCGDEICCPGPWSHGAYQIRQPPLVAALCAEVPAPPASRRQLMDSVKPSIESELAAIRRMDELQRLIDNHGMDIHVFVLRPCWHVTLTLVRAAGNIEAKAKATSFETALVKAGANLDALVGGRY